MNRPLAFAVAAILGASTLTAAAAASAGGSAGGRGDGVVPAVDRGLADPPPESHRPAEPGGGANTVPCPNCWT